MNEMIFSSVFPFWDKLDDDDKTAIKDGHITKTFEKGSAVSKLLQSLFLVLPPGLNAPACFQ